ncbi:hypothetical protein [Rarobacter incanus]|uniref:Uncharacterized protein n=1 Tax=Rarobacter incanus TaxID=153494 RepID=A0A542SQ62_9MICO|nr:hypothetical protein [Rarobacter incanus]TQK76753.1 hypothetical protein FB389_1443 [Rarobacter incanus]
MLSAEEASAGHVPGVEVSADAMKARATDRFCFTCGRRRLALDGAEDW